MYFHNRGKIVTSLLLVTFAILSASNNFVAIESHEIATSISCVRRLAMVRHL